ncbi:MAG: hypothetical protein ACRCZF_05595, partial [Gemmataceae bacterium]
PLFAIVRKALHINPAERYTSVQDLGRDVEAWLADQPVTAHPDPWRERLRRWAQRNRTIVSTLAVSTTVAGIALAIGTLLVASLNRNLASTNRTLETQSAELTANNTKLQEANTRATRSLNAALETLDQSISQFQEEPALKQPGFQEVRTRLLTNSRQRLEPLVADLRQEEALRDRYIWAYLKLGRLALDLEEFDKAIRIFESLRTELQSSANEETTTFNFREALAHLENDIAITYRRMRRFPEAEAKFRVAQKEYEKLLETERSVVSTRIDLAGVENNRGNLLGDQNRHPEARDCFERAYQQLQKIGADPTATPTQIRHIQETIARVLTNLTASEPNALAKPDGATAPTALTSKQAILTRSLEFYRRATSSPDADQDSELIWDHIKAANQLGLLLTKSNQMQQGIIVWKEAADLLVRYYRLAPTMHERRSNAASIHLNLATHLEYQGNYTGGLAQAELALNHYQILMALNPGNDELE